MEELLSLKWNNHRNAFYHSLITLRKQESFSDVTLACDGHLYKVHKMVLATCSDYFNNIFKSLHYSDTVIVLKDISHENLESLLDYMYIGEVNVSQDKLSSLIQAAECLQLKGLAVEDSDYTNLSKSSSARKRHRSPTIAENKISKTSHEDDTSPSSKESSTIKCESRNEELITTLTTSDIPNIVKEEADPIIMCDYENKWEICENELDDLPSQDNPATYDPFQYPQQSSDFSLEKDTSTNYGLDQSTSSYDNVSASTPKTSSKSWEHRCTYCYKFFRVPSELKRHVRMHTGEKPFGCPHCAFKSSRKNQIVIHMARVHQDFSKECLVSTETATI